MRIGISTHDERLMLNALQELGGLDYIMFPYNFIHARADYAEFLPAAVAKRVGLIAIKPLAAGVFWREPVRSGFSFTCQPRVTRLIVSPDINMRVNGFRHCFLSYA